MILPRILNAKPLLGNYKNLCFDHYATSEPSENNSNLEKIILELPDRAKIPIPIYRKYSVNDIARSIIKRWVSKEKEFENEINFSEGAIVDMSNDVDIVLHFWPRDLQSIIEKGFINLHQKGTSNGNRDIKRRLKIEDANIGLQLGSNLKAIQLRPKSAFLNIRADVDIGEVMAEDLISQFGEIGAVMKSEVKRRSLWVASDSFKFGYERSKTLDVSFQKIMHFMGTFFRGKLPKRIKERYFETLILGELSLDDVDHFVVSSPDLLGILKPIGIPVYLGHWEIRNGHLYNNTKFKQLFGN